MKIGILGAGGRMGQRIAAELESGVYSAQGLKIARGQDAGHTFADCDVMIDFTVPQATATHAQLAARYNRPLVIGTTGLGEKEEAALIDAAKTVPVLYAANMSLGVNLLLTLVEEAAARLNEDFDIEIFEAHHRNKADAPSGTALALGRAAAKGRGVSFEAVKTTDRTGARKAGDIGFAVFRGGDVVGEHAVTFAGKDEHLILTHKAIDRSIFARGAIRAALWLKDKKPGLYSMRDVLKNRP